MSEQVVLVDVNDNEIGVMEKLTAHQKGLLHRAFSIFLFNSDGELLMQQRALSKYHSAGLWSNTCCSHPSPNESLNDATKRRLVEELGMTCDMQPAFSFTYKADFDNGLIEHEFDHVFFGFTDSTPNLNKEEVNDWKYMAISDLEKDIENQPQLYTEWLKDCLNKVIQHQANKNS